MTARPSLHATTAVVGEAGVLIRGPSGSGKTRLALALVEAARLRGRFAALVADDRTLLAPRGARLVAWPHPALAGRAERRGIGVVAVDHEPACVLGLVVDLVAGMPARLPGDGDRWTALAGVTLPRLALAAGTPASDAAADVLARLAEALLPPPCQGRRDAQDWPPEHGNRQAACPGTGEDGSEA